MKSFFSLDGSNVLIRRAVSGDVGVLIELSKKAFEHDVSTLGEGPLMHDSLEHMLENITLHHTFIIFNDSYIPIGGVVVRLINSFTCHLSLIFFSEEVQGQGLGKAVMLYLMNDVFFEVSHWETYTVRDNPGTKKFYENLGFIKVKEEKPGKVFLTLYEWSRE